MTLFDISFSLELVRVEILKIFSIALRKILKYYLYKVESHYTFSFAFQPSGWRAWLTPSGEGFGEGNSPRSKF